jgi:hypothetical protein
MDQNPLRTAYAWIRHQINGIGEIKDIHHAHTPGLRIRIPVERLRADAPEWTPTPAVLRIRIPSIRAGENVGDNAVILMLGYIRPR